MVGDGMLGVICYMVSEANMEVVLGSLEWLWLCIHKSLYPHLTLSLSEELIIMRIVSPCLRQSDVVASHCHIQQLNIVHQLSQHDCGITLFILI